MGVVNELFDMVGICSQASKKLKMDPQDVTAVSSLFQKAKSISAQASKYVMEYPVACSTTITDYKVALAITKQVEFDCARFVILASGLNPIVDQHKGDSVSSHINTLVSSYESFSGVKVSIEPATPEMIESGEIYMANYFDRTPYSLINDDTETSKLAYTLENNSGSTQTQGQTQQQTQGQSQRQSRQSQNNNKGNNDNSGSYYFIDKNNGIGNNGGVQYDDVGAYLDNAEGKKSAQNGYNPKDDYALDADTARSAVRGLHEIDNKLGKVGPTIVNVRMYVRGGDGTDRAVDFPLAIKATLQYVDAIDINQMLNQIDNKSRKLFKVFQLTSGEIKFFKDFLFALDSVKGDVERERLVGNTPFFRRLMSNKSKYRFKTVSNTLPVIKNFVANKTQQDLPMCTIVIDESELRGIKLRLTDCLKNRQKYIDPILDTYMLLGLGIVDSDNGVIHFFYSGEPYPVTCDIEKIGKRGGDNKDFNSDLAKALANMSRLVSKH